MTAPFDHEALWLKAKLFLSRAMDESEPRSFDEQALWAALGLELLGKAALSRTSPLLIAEPSEDGKNLLVAAGLVQGGAQFTSVRAKTIFERCQRAFPPFSRDEALRITNARNDYLHGAAPGFTLVPSEAWWPSFWRQAIILNGASDRTIDELVGADRAGVVETHLQRNKLNIEHRVEMLINQAQTRRTQYEAGTLPVRVAERWTPGQDLSLGMTHSDQVECPACGSWGRSEGDITVDTEDHVEWYGEDHFDSAVTLTIAAEYFSCPECGLILENVDLMIGADLADTFKVEGDYSDMPGYGDEYGND